MNYIDFKYYLRYDVAGTWHYYYVDNAGVVQDTTTPTPLTYTPKNWSEIVLTWERGFTYHGVFQAFTIPIEFVKDGAKILRYLYVNYGTEGACQLYIEKFNRTIAVYDYEPYYFGDVDFSRFNDKKDFVNVEIMEGGFWAKLKAKENTNFQIDVIDNPDVIWVSMDGLELQAVFNFIGIDQPNDNVTIPTYTDVNTFNAPTLLFYITEGYSNGDNNPKGNEYLGLFSNFYKQVYGGFVSMAMGDKWFIHNSSESLTYDYQIKGSLNIGTIANVNSTKCRLRALRFLKDDSVVIQDHPIADGVTYLAGTSGTEIINFDTTISVAPNEVLILWFFYTNLNAGNPHQAHIFSLDLKVFVLNKVFETYVPALRTFDVFTQLVADIDADAVASSTLLQTTEATKVITSGDALRLLEKSQLQTNFTEFYNSMKCAFNTCLKFDKDTQTIEIAPVDEAYDEATQILDLGTINNLVTTPFTTEMFAKLKIGYPDVKFDTDNGKDEFNILQEYQSPLIRVTSEKQLVSDYHASMYEIELARANLTDKIMADNDSDNDVFWLHIEPTVAGTVPAGLPGAGQDFYYLERGGYTITSGLISPTTAFNLYMSVKKCLFRHGNYINSVLYPQYDLLAALTFQASSKTQNNEDFLIWDTGGPTIYEKQTEDLQDLDSMIFYPIIFEFDSIIPASILSILDTNPYGKVKFTYNELDYYGFIISMSDKPILSNTQSYKLLCSISTNLNNIIT